MKAIQALKEAEAYHDGPSIVICYAPCANHGIKGGLSNSIDVERKAVECGYFLNFRFDPKTEKVTFDSKEPDFNKFREFVMRETRYSQLPKVNPAHAEELLTTSQKMAVARYNRIKKFA